MASAICVRRWPKKTNVLRAIVRLPEKNFSAALNYPPIHDESAEGKKLRKKREWRDFIGSLPTVEEKLYHMCQDKKLIGYVLQGVSKNYNSLPLRQHSTRTRLVDGLPSCYRDANVDDVYEALKGRLAEAVVFAYEQHRYRQRHEATPIGPMAMERRLGHTVLGALCRTLHAALAADHPHLRTAQIDIEPRCEAFWTCGNFEALPHEKKYKPLEPLRNNVFLYSGHPNYQIRTTEPLPQFIPKDDALFEADDVPNFPHDPKTIGCARDERYPVLLPGCWPNEKSGFAHSSFHTLEELHLRRKNFGIVDEEECISEFGLTASYAWLLGIASQQGFGPWTELTYPFTTQTVITDGQNWNFFAYQLNTTCLFNEHDHNRHVNLCWKSSSMKLFDIIENGVMKGCNEEVFKLLIRIVSKIPQVPNKKDSNLQPYLKDTPRNEEWSLMFNKLFDYYSQRPLKKVREEYQWEKIYLKTNSYISVNPNRKR